MALFFGYWYGKCHFKSWTHKVSQLLSFKSSAKINNVWYCFNNVLKMCPFLLFMAVSWQNSRYFLWFGVSTWADFQRHNHFDFAFSLFYFIFSFFLYFSFFPPNRECELFIFISVSLEVTAIYEFPFSFLKRRTIDFPLHFVKVTSFRKSPSDDHRVGLKVFTQIRLQTFVCYHYMFLM